MLEGPDNPLKELVIWYKSLYWIPGKLCFWIGVAVLVLFVFVWVTHDNTRHHHAQIRVTRGIQQSDLYNDNMMNR